MLVVSLELGADAAELNRRICRSSRWSEPSRKSGNGFGQAVAPISRRRRWAGAVAGAQLESRAGGCVDAQPRDRRAVEGDGAGKTVADCCATKSNALGMSNVSSDAGDRSIDRSEGSRRSPKSWRPRLPMLSFIKSSSWPKELLKSKDSSPRPKRFACDGGTKRLESGGAQLILFCGRLKL